MIIGRHLLGRSDDILGMPIRVLFHAGRDRIGIVRARSEKFPLAKVNEAYERMVSGKAEFSVVLPIGS
jgi:hypothetical protein